MNNELTSGWNHGAFAVIKAFTCIHQGASSLSIIIVTCTVRLLLYMARYINLKATLKCQGLYTYETTNHDCGLGWQMIDAGSQLLCWTHINLVYSWAALHLLLQNTISYRIPHVLMTCTTRSSFLTLEFIVLMPNSTSELRMKTEMQECTRDQISVHSCALTMLSHFLILFVCVRNIFAIWNSLKD